MLDCAKDLSEMADERIKKGEIKSDEYFLINVYDTT
jgi:hypothetical protein